MAVSRCKARCWGSELPHGMGLVACAVLVWACNSVDEGALDQIQAVSTPPDAGSGKPPPPPPDTGSAKCHTGECWWSVVNNPDGANACMGVGRPTEEMAPSAPTDATVPDLPPIYLGWSRLWLGQSQLGSGGMMASGGVPEDGGVPGMPGLAEPWTSFGFDLDGVCTDSSSCGEASASATSCKQTGSQVPYDGSGCRDNTFARYQPVVAAAPELGEVYGLTEAAINCSLLHGDYTQVIRISGYNGLPDDPEVRVDYYASTGTLVSKFWSCPVQDYDKKYPRWLPDLEWRIDADDLAEPVSTPGSLPDSKRHSRAAYVRDGHLVAFQQEEILFQLPGDESVYPGWGMTVQQGLLTGELSMEQGGTWAIKGGLLGGRIKGGDLLRSFRNLGLCPDGAFGPVYETVEDYVLQGVDLLADGGFDPGRACDAMSIGIGFEAHALTPGPAVEVNPLLDCCEPEGLGTPSCPVGCGDGRMLGSERCDTGIPDGEPGACAAACEGSDACHPQMLVGEACESECIEMTITALQDDDGCCPTGGNATNDNDCPAVCGNSIFEPGELCDPPGTCPSGETCGSGDVCAQAVYTGDPSTCDAVCASEPITACQDDDSCCAPGCTVSDDNDCPRPEDCGNGMTDRGETCDGDCRSTCDDDDVCTDDVQFGSPETCNIRCVNRAVTSCQNDDGCCPSACNANNDNDCGTKCPNGVTEEGEECDDNNEVPLDGCHECKKESAQEQCESLLEMDGTVSEACKQCQCTKCAEQFVACTNGPDPTENEQCAEVVRCGNENSCVDQLTCYCGAAFLCINPTGPCVSEINIAAGSDSPVDVSVRAEDTAYPVARAKLVGTCSDDNCATECL